MYIMYGGLILNKFFKSKCNQEIILCASLSSKNSAAEFERHKVQKL